MFFYLCKSDFIFKSRGVYIDIEDLYTINITNKGGDMKSGTLYKSVSNSQKIAFLGWFVVTSSFLFMLYGWLSGNLEPGWFLGLLAGFLMIDYENGLIPLSHSSKELLLESRSQRKIFSHLVHKMPYIKKRTLKNEANFYDVLGIGLITLVVASLICWFIYGVIPSVNIQTLLFYIFLLVSFIYGIRNWGSRGIAALSMIAIFALLVFNQAPVLSEVLLFLTTSGIAIWAWIKHDWGFLLLDTILYYLAVILWVSSYTGNNTGWGISVLGVTGLAILGEISLWVSLVLNLPFVTIRRVIAEREVTRLIILINALGFIFVDSWLLSVLIPLGWAQTYGLAILLTAALAGLTWVKNGRYSYAKYFTAATLIAILISCVTYFQPTLLVLTWLAVAIVTLTVGFAFQSYSLRIFGLFILGGAFLHYFFTLIPSSFDLVSQVNQIPNMIASPIWLGIIMASFMVVLAFWYGDLKEKTMELKWQKLIVLSLYSGAVLTVLTIFLYQTNVYF